MPTATQTDVAAAVAAFSLTDAQIEALGKIIFEQARIPTYTARYQRAANTLKVTLPADWQPNEAALRKMAADALASAKSIAATYHSDLEAQARKLDSESKALHKSLASGIADWAKERAGWKSVQISNYEASDAGDDGTFDAIADIVSGDIEPGVNLDDMEISCLPADAVEERCQEYAGNTYSLDEYEDLRGIMPMHSGCPHDFFASLG